MKFYLTSTLLIITICTYSQAPLSSDSLSRYYDMSLEDLQKLKASGVSSELEKLINSLMSVASQKAMSTRETPGIVSLITEDEIKKSGARDFIDILRLIPGFDFAYDGEGSIGLGVRGNWANDGKVLLLIDGQQMNEIFKGSLSFGNHFPVSNISRIEIIRGPGSAIYGGFAELGVINIITKKGSEIDGAAVTATFGQTRQTYGRRNLEFALGKKISDLDISITGIAGQGNLSDRTAWVGDQLTTPSNNNLYTGTYRSLARQSDNNPLMLNLKADYKNLSFKTIFDYFKTSIIYIGDQNANSFLNQAQKSINSELSYNWKLSQKVTITPRLSYISQVPEIIGLPDTLNISQDYGRRIKGGVTSSYDPSRKINIVLGTEYYYDKATNSADSIRTVNGVVSSISYENYAAFTQLTFRSRVANLILGGRYDHNSNYGDAFVPRVGVTKKIKKFHSKFLYSQSFRAPTFENIARGISSFDNLTPGIKPEKTTVIELEAGYQLTKNQLIAVNIFDTKIKDPIVYNSTGQLYSNYDESGTKGFEIEHKLKTDKVSITTNYSFYSVSGKKRIDSFTTQNFTADDTFRPTGEEEDNDVLLAFPAHKISLNSTLKLKKNISFSPSAIYYSKRYGYDLDATGQPREYTLSLHQYSSSLLLNAYLSFNNIFRGLDAGLGAYNLTNANYDYLTPSFSRNGSLPSLSREYIIRFSYHINGR